MANISERLMSVAWKLSLKRILLLPFLVLCVFHYFGALRLWQPTVRFLNTYETGRLIIPVNKGERNAYSTLVSKQRANISNFVRAPFTAIPRNEWVKYPSATWHGYPLPVMTVTAKGRMGNIMGEYATLFALSKIYNVTAFVLPKMVEKLSFFQSLSLPKLPVPFTMSEWDRVGKTGSLQLYNYTRIEEAASGGLGPKCFAIYDFPFEIQLFNSVKEELRREFTFSEELRQKTQGFLAHVVRQWQSASNSTLTPVLVGFHVRRTDYAHHAQLFFGFRLPENEYYMRALKYYREKYPNKVAFVVGSDDKDFIRSRLSQEPDVYFSPAESPEEDMTLLSSCNHSIITTGSFGFWTGYLTGGEVVYPDLKVVRNYRFSRNMFETAGLKNFTPLPVD